MNHDIKEAEGACHCGTVRFRVRLSDGLHSARRCTCSYCRMRGAVAVSADLDGLEILEGEDALTLYTFNTGTAKHFSARNAESTPSTSAVPTRANTASMPPASKASRHSILRSSR